MARKAQIEAARRLERDIMALMEGAEDVVTSTQLAEQLDTSPDRVREALYRLERDGEVKRQQIAGAVSVVYGWTLINRELIRVWRNFCFGKYTSPSRVFRR